MPLRLPPPAFRPRALAQGLGVLALGLVLVGPIACRDLAQEAKARRRQVVVRFAQEPDLLNPYLTGMSAGLEACSPVFEGLLTVDDQLRHVPVLAQRVPSLANGDVRLVGAGMEITYRLKQGVRWHDGHPLSSADVAFTQSFVMNPKLAIMERQGHDLVEAIETPDPWTVKVRLKEVYGPYLQLFRAILPAHRLRGLSDPTQSPFLKAPIGTGPFQFAGWVPGQKIVYAANPQWHGGRPQLDGLEARILPNDEAAFLAFKRKEVDLLLDLTQVQGRAVRSMGPGFTFHATRALQWEQLSFRLDHPILKDLRVRQAILHAIDREALAKHATDGAWPAAWSDQHPRSWAHDPGMVGAFRPDPARAARLLDEAGWRLGWDGLRRRGGQRLILGLTTTQNARRRKNEVAYIQASLRRLGMEVRPEFYPSATLFASPPEGRLATGRFDMAIWAWDAGPDPDNVNLWHSARIPPKGTNYSRLRDPVVDQLLSRATRSLNQGERAKLYRQCSHRLAEVVPMIPLVDWMSFDATGPHLLGFRPNPSSAGNLWNVGQWRWVESQAVGR